MKSSASIIKNTILLIILIGNASCSYTYEILNRNDVAKDVGYSSGKLPYQMNTSDLQAPMFSKKGQVYSDGSLGNSLGLGAGVAIGEKDFLMGRFSKFQKTGIEAADQTFVEATYEYTEYDYFFGTSYTYSGDTAGVFTYSKDYELVSENYELGYGRFQNMKRNFRNEWIAGAGWGSSQTKYSLSMYNDFISFTEQRKYITIYLQDDFGWVRKTFEVVAIGRLNGYFFHDRSFSMDLEHEAPSYQKSAFSAEGAIRICYGFKFLKAYLQATGTLPVLSPEIEWTPAQLKFGILMKLGK